MPNQYTKAKELGIPYIRDDSSEAKAKRSSAISRGNRKRFTDPAARIKASASMRRAVLNSPDSYSANNVCGRVKITEYKNEKFHGQWEVDVAKWFDSKNILWERKTLPIEYNWNGKKHLYFPDFYLPKYNLFVEVKGYETERDRCKWSALDNLVIFKSAEITAIRKDCFEFAPLAQG